jgi:hypothetical protein
VIAPISYIQPLTTLRRKRRLPVEGQVTVSNGDMVQSGDTVARAQLNSRHMILDAGRALGLPPERAQEMIQREVGEAVEEGAILAGKRGVGARQLRAPVAGTIAAISEGQVLLQVSDESAQLLARVPGQIVEVAPNRGVTIECVCAWAQAMWGNGRLDEGALQLTSNRADEMFTADQVDMSLRGAILVAGRCEHRQALELAAQVPIRGLVLGSLATKLMPIAQKVSYPILLMEGFGTTPMNADAFKLFSNHNGDVATINAQAADALTGDRPELIIPIKDAGKPPQTVEMQSFRIGQNVRVMTGPDKGRLGEILNLLPPSTLFESGIRASGAMVALEYGPQSSYPLANLELLG